jgi:AcrR family transcriptional regulator
MKTRDKILQTALNLFNERGVPNITLRQIAAAMFISQGNLNYHFKHREDIIEALFFQLMETFEAEKAKLDSEEQMDFQFLIDSTRNEMETLFKFRFFMIDFNQNMRENPKLHEQFKQLEETRRITYLQIFDLAIKAGIMRAPAFEGEYNGLNQRIRVFSDYWIASAAVNNEPVENSVEKYHNLLVEMFFAYFTRDSQREFLLKRL